MIKKLLILSLLALAATPLPGQSAKEVADSLTLPAELTGGSRLPLPAVPGGAKIQLGGADFEQIISKDGSVRHVLSDVPVRIFFTVTKDGQTAQSKDYDITIKPADPAAENANPKPATIPTILQWKGSKGEWKPGPQIRVYNANNAALPNAKDFCHELRSLFPTSKVKLVNDAKQADICLSLLSEASLQANEAYTMKITPDKIRIIGHSPTGTYWGTRTLLQILAHQGAVPCGEAADFPRYAVRGCMLDIARTHYSLQDLRDLVDLMAWYKMNDLHLVINNNYIFHENYVDTGRDPLKESYAAFRLESKVKGKDGTPLTAQDLSYSKKDFRALINYAKERGVNIVPEFDTPGHALSFTRVRPDLIYQGPMRNHGKRRCEMLDAANPETLQFVKGVFDEYLLKDKKLGRPVFDGCVIHVGSDEFFGAAEDYRKYTNGVLSHVLKRGYTPRVWGSLSAKKGKTPVVSKGVQMNIWSKDWMLPQEAINQGYDIINTFDRDLYIVPFANYYRMDRNHKGIYENWQPNKMWNQQIPAGHPQLLGATFAVWNDLCDIRHRGYGMLDIWDLLAGSMNTLCAKLWGAQQQAIPFDRHRALAQSIGHGPSLTPQKNNNNWQPITPGKLPTALRRQGVRPPYHLTIQGLKLTKATPGQEQALLSGPDGVLLGVMKDGTIGFRRADGMEFSWDAKLPEGREVKLELIATLGKTRLFIDGKEIEKMTLNNYNSIDENFNKRTRDIISTFILPAKTLGETFQGTIKNLQLTPAK